MAVELRVGAVQVADEPLGVEPLGVRAEVCLARGLQRRHPRALRLGREPLHEGQVTVDRVEVPGVADGTVAGHDGRRLVAPEPLDGDE